ncbi:MAG TPA: hypothetical protein VER17_05685, partial [Tepidisphaeraceae bacterium]|nr:hypothetical protein [Tepidisphaeraceae bacterium]
MRTISVGPFLAACLVASLAFPGCKREEEAALPAPPAATAPATAPRPPTTSYVEVVRQSYPKLPATQPLSIPLDMAYAGHWVLPDPVYLCPRGDLWITRGDALPLGEAIKKAVEEQVHLTRERVAYVQWTQDAEGKPYPRLLVHASAAATPEGGGGGYEWIDRDEVGAEQRRPATAGRAYRWDEVLPWGDRLVVPTDRGVAIFSFAPQYKEDYREVLTSDQIAAGANPPQVLQDPRGLLVWSPWDGRRPGGRGALRLVDDKWVDLAATAQWPAKILHLVPLLDGSVLQLLRGDDDKVSVALATLDAGTIDEAAIAKLVETLSEDDPEQRAAAYAELTRFGPASWPVLERLLPEQPPEAQIRMQQILKDRIQPSLGGRTLVDGAVQLASRFADAGVLLYAPAGVSIPQQQDDKPPQIVKPAWISVRPGHAIELLEPVLTKDAAPDRQHFYAFGDEWVVSDPVQGPRRLLGNHLVPMLRKDERRFAHVVGADRRGRWLFRRSKDGAPLSLAVSPGAASPGPVSPGDAEKTSTSRPAPAQPAAGLWPSPQPTTGAASPQPASQPTTAPEGATAGAAAELASIAPADATLILDPTLPDPTPRLPVWLMHVPNGLAGWSARDFPVIKRGGGWVLVERGWQPLDESKDKLLTLGPPPKPVPVPGRPPPPNLPRDPGAAIGPLPGPAGRGGFLRRPAARPAPVAPNAVA